MIRSVFAYLSDGLNISEHFSCSTLVNISGIEIRTLSNDVDFEAKMGGDCLYSLQIQVTSVLFYFYFGKVLVPISAHTGFTVTYFMDTNRKQVGTIVIIEENCNQNVQE